MDPNAAKASGTAHAAREATRLVAVPCAETEAAKTRPVDTIKAAITTLTGVAPAHTTPRPRKTELITATPRIANSRTKMQAMCAAKAGPTPEAPERARHQRLSNLITVSASEDERRIEIRHLQIGIDLEITAHTRAISPFPEIGVPNQASENIIRGAMLFYVPVSERLE
jgi:hypothetical protein